MMNMLIGGEKAKILHWGILGFLCTTVHLYFLPMCFIILCAFLYYDIRRQGKIKGNQAFILFGFWAGVLIPMLMLGGFMQGMSISSLGFTWKKTFNLNGFFNAQGWSRIFPKLILHTYGQSEGFSYLGLGIFAGILFSGLYFVRYLLKIRMVWKKIVDICKVPKIQALTGILFLSVVTAASPVVTLGSRAVTIPFPQRLEEIWMIFRACGRLIWPGVYVIVFVVIIFLLKMKNEKYSTVLLLVCVLLQGWDISAEAVDRGKVASEPKPFVSDLQDEGWQIIGKNPNIKNVVYVNVSGLDSCASMAEYADNHNMTLGRFYYARDYNEVIEKSTEQALANKSTEDIFLFNSSRMIDAWNEPDLYYYEMDGKIIGYCKLIEGLEEKRICERDYEYIYAYEITEGSRREEIIDEFLFLHAGGMAVSPVFQLPRGTYRFTVEGENMKDADILISDGEIEGQEMQVISGTVSYCNTGEFKICIKNNSDHDMVLYDIRLQPLD